MRRLATKYGELRSPPLHEGFDLAKIQSHLDHLALNPFSKRNHAESPILTGDIAGHVIIQRNATTSIIGV
jgi:hypothetical protein